MPRRPGRTACRWPAAVPRRRRRTGRTTRTGPKTSLLHDLGVLRGVDHQRGLVVGAAGQRPTAARRLRATTLAPSARARSTKPATRSCWRRDTSGPWSVALVHRVAEHDRAHQVGDPGDEGVVERALDVGPGGGGAVLAGVDQRAGDRALHRGLQVGVVEDHERRLAAELEVHPLRPDGTRAPSPGGPTAGGAGEGHHVDVGMADQRLAGHPAGAGDHVDDPVGDAGLGGRPRRTSGR